MNGQSYSVSHHPQTGNKNCMHYLLSVYIAIIILYLQNDISFETGKVMNTLDKFSVLPGLGEKE